MFEFKMPPIIRRQDGKIGDEGSIKSPESEGGYKGVWERVSEKALEIVTKERELHNDSVKMERVKDILVDPAFKERMNNVWAEQSLKKGGVVDDPAKQDELWAKGLALKLKDMIDN